MNRYTHQHSKIKFVNEGLRVAIIIIDRQISQATV